MTSEILVTICVAIFASSGFWGLLTYLIQKHDTFKSAESDMLKGLGHDRICYLGQLYIKQGYIEKDDYENLHDYLYLPYKKLGGNGTAEKIMNEVEKLPLKKGGANNVVHK